jgi:hypothetical protein
VALKTIVIVLNPALWRGVTGGGSTWRPSHRPSAEQVEMEVKDRLSGLGAAVHHEPISRGVELILPSQPIRELERPA